MRSALVPALAFAAALAACTVDIEGAKCNVAGATDNCPSGQACGTGLTCSVRAASCAPCEMGAIECRSGTIDVMKCSAASDPVCGTWTVATACAAGAQTCAAPLAGGAPECACERWTVAPEAAAAACIRPSINSAISAATRFPAPVVVLGGAAFTYGNALDDSAPIIIPAGLTLIGDDATPASATNRIIAVQGPGPEGLRVHPGAVVRGVAVQRGATATNELTIGVLLTGGPAASGNTLVSVRVDAMGAGGGFAIGLRVAGGNVVASANTIAMSDVLVRGATVAGLEVNRLGASDVVIVTDSVFDSNHVGVSLLKGDLALRASTVKSSVAEGVSAVSGSGSLTILDGIVAHSGATGIVLTAIQALSLERTRICGNAGSDKLYGGQTRKVGGLYSQGPRPPRLAFLANRIHANTGDQMYVVASAATWDISGPGGVGGCATGVPNVFAGYSAPGVGLAALATNVLALNNSWEVSYPLDGVDFTASGTCGAAACGIDVGTGSGNVCLPAAPADLACPAP